MIDRIKEVIKRQVNIEVEIEEDVDLNVYGIDSLAKVQLLVELEEVFGIEFEEDDINQDNFNNVMSIKNIISKYIEK